MIRLVAFAAVVPLALSACGDNNTMPQRKLADAQPSDAVEDAFVPPPPPFDAAPPPVVSCDFDAGAGCALPPSTCLDSHYLVYYTGGTCDAATCSFVTNLLYCYGECSNGGCLGGFT